MRKLFMFTAAALVAAWSASAWAQSNAASQPETKPSEKDMASVAKVLADVKEYDQASADKAENDLVAKGAAIASAIKESLGAAKPFQKAPAFNAMVRLTWKLDPRKAILDWLKQQKAYKEATADMLNLQPATDTSVAKVCPGHVFYTQVFRTYPVARLQPPPLKFQNVFAVSRKGEVTLMTSDGQLELFLMDNAQPAKDEHVAADVAKCYLLLTETFSQDGFLKFSIPADGIKVTKQDGGMTATGKAVVDAKGGNEGTIEAKVSFDKAGKCTGLECNARIKAGIRPLCQATRLLNPDPVIREIMRRDLLVMGSSAREYVMEQRAKASPELRKEIDKVWQEILPRERE